MKPNGRSARGSTPAQARSRGSWSPDQPAEEGCVRLPQVFRPPVALPRPRPPSSSRALLDLGSGHHRDDLTIDEEEDSDLNSRPRARRCQPKAAPKKKEENNDSAISSATSRLARDSTESRWWCSAFFPARSHRRRVFNAGDLRGFGERRLLMRMLQLHRRGAVHPLPADLFPLTLRRVSALQEQHLRQWIRTSGNSARKFVAFTSSTRRRFICLRSNSGWRAAYGRRRSRDHKHPDGSPASLGWAEAGFGSPGSTGIK